MTNNFSRHRGGAIAVALLLVGGLAALSIGGKVTKSGGGFFVNQPVVDYCAKEPAQVESVLASWRGMGVIVERDDEHVIVDEPRWAQTMHDAKVSIGVAAYCKAITAKGVSTTILIKGLRDGKVYASVVNGHYSD